MKLTDNWSGVIPGGRCLLHSDLINDNTISNEIVIKVLGLWFQIKIL